jgi:hypothetical protein
MLTDVFISYSRNDRALAQTLADELTAKGLAVWWDSELLSGEDFRAAILARLVEAKAVIVIWSRQAVSSRWVCEEAEEAAQALKLIAVGAPGFDVRELPLGLRSFQVVPIANRAGIFAAVTAALEGRLNAHNPLQRKTLLELWFERAKRNWGVILAAAAAVLALFIATTPFWLANAPQGSNVFSSWSADEQALIALAVRLDQEVQAATLHRAPPLVLADFKTPLATIEELRKRDPNNGNVPYYSAVIQRWIEKPGAMSEEIHNGYYRYLELVQLLPASITRTGPEAKFCHVRPWGFCTQRTAWINHQMAWDFLRWADKADPATRRIQLGHALNHARASLCLRAEGFVQGKSTALMVAEIERELGTPPVPCQK